MKLLGLLTSVLFTFSCSLTGMGQAKEFLKISSAALMTHGNKVKLYHNDTLGFAVKTADGLFKMLPKYDIDPVLRGKTSALIKAFCEKGGYLSLNTMNNGDFSLRSHVRGLGGGPGGAAAGSYVGKFLTYLVAHGAIIVVSAGANIIVPGSGIAVGIALEKTLAGPIEVASNVGAITCGIVGAVVTGPA